MSKPKLTKLDVALLRRLADVRKEGPIPDRMLPALRRMALLKYAAFDDENFVSITKLGRAAIKDKP